MIAKALLLLAASTSLATATLNVVPFSYGRFPCTKWDSEGKMYGDDSMCQHDKLVATGVSLDSLSNYMGFKRDRPIPTGAHCQQDPDSGGYFCGIQGASCTDDSCCDNGKCDENNQCTGGYGEHSDNNSGCSGYLWCTPFGGSGAGSSGGTCGGDGCYCQDWDQWDLSTCTSDEQRWSRFDRNCQSGYCNSKSGHCAPKCTTAGSDCSHDPDHCCGEGLKPVVWGDKCTCQPIHGGSQRARARRNVKFVESLCPKSYAACAIGGSKGFECVDTQTSLEQCGGCLESGEGVDCTSLPNVSAVGCVAGVCEIWACDAGFEYDPADNACRRSA